MASATTADKSSEVYEKYQARVGEVAAVAFAGSPTIPAKRRETAARTVGDVMFVLAHPWADIGRLRGEVAALSAKKVALQDILAWPKASAKRRALSESKLTPVDIRAAHGEALLRARLAGKSLKREP